MAEPRCLAGLYAITPDCPDRQRLLAGVAAALEGGCALLQYRDKTSDAAERQARAEALATLCARHGTPLIVNDDLDLAVRVGAAGVHLGREDGGVALARARLGESALIGASCYDDFGLARAAVQAGADYVAFGAVYPSSTKPGAVAAPLGLFGHARTDLPVPACAIGGITLARAPALIAAGASLLAVITDLFDDLASPAAIAERARAYQLLFKDQQP